MAILCHCHGVNDRTIRRAIDRGAHTVDEIGDACRAGTTCGGCWPTLDELLRAAGHRGGHRSPAATTG